MGSHRPAIGTDVDPRPRRVVVAGASGSGKTTLARRLATRLGVEHVELDALHHLPDWRTRPVEEFRALVDTAAPADGSWVVDGNYRSKLGDLLWSRADTVVYLDLPRWRVMTQLVPRTLRRAATREELWHGNRERWRTLLSRDPDRNIVLWSWTTHRQHRERLDEAGRDERWSSLRLVRLRSRREVETFLSIVP